MFCTGLAFFKLKIEEPTVWHRPSPIQQHILTPVDQGAGKLVTGAGCAYDDVPFSGLFVLWHRPQTSSFAPLTAFLQLNFGQYQFFSSTVAHLPTPPGGLSRFVSLGLFGGRFAQPQDVHSFS